VDGTDAIVTGQVTIWRDRDQVPTLEACSTTNQWYGLAGGHTRHRSAVVLPPRHSVRGGIAVTVTVTMKGWV
jgi:hypothetical protein